MRSVRTRDNRERITREARRSAASAGALASRRLAQRRLAATCACQAPAQTRVSVPHSVRQDSTMLLLPRANVACHRHSCLCWISACLQFREPLPPTSKPASQPFAPESRDSKASPARHPEHPLQSEVAQPGLAAVESRSTSSEGRLQTRLGWSDPSGRSDRDRPSTHRSRCTTKPQRYLSLIANRLYCRQSTTVRS